MSVRRPGRPVSGDNWRNKYLQELRVGGTSVPTDNTILPTSTIPITNNDIKNIPPIVSKENISSETNDQQIPLPQSPSLPNTTILTKKSSIKNIIENDDEDNIFGYSMEGIQKSLSTIVSNQPPIVSSKERHISNADSDTVSSIDEPIIINPSQDTSIPKSSGAVAIQPNNSSQNSLPNQPNISSSWRSNTTSLSDSTTPTINGRLLNHPEQPGSYNSEENIYPNHPSQVSLSQYSSLITNDKGVIELSHSIPETIAPVYELSRLYTNNNKHNNIQNTKPITKGIIIEQEQVIKNVDVFSNTTTTSSSSIPVITNNNNNKFSAVITSNTNNLNINTTIPNPSYMSNLPHMNSPHKGAPHSILHPTLEEDDEEDENDN